MTPERIEPLGLISSRLPEPENKLVRARPQPLPTSERLFLLSLLRSICLRLVARNLLARFALLYLLLRAGFFPREWRAPLRERCVGWHWSAPAGAVWRRSGSRDLPREEVERRMAFGKRLRNIFLSLVITPLRDFL